MLIVNNNRTVNLEMYEDIIYEFSNPMLYVNFNAQYLNDTIEKINLYIFFYYQSYLFLKITDWFICDK